MSSGAMPPGSGAVAYAPGNWTAVTSDRLWALIDISVEDRRIGELWAAAREGLESVIDVLLSGGIRGLPGFAVVELSDTGVRYAARPPVRLTVESDGVTNLIQPQAGAGWMEGAFPEESERITISVVDDARPTLPTGAGVVRADAVEIVFGGQADRIAAPESSPSVRDAEPVASRGTPGPDSPSHDVATYYELLVASTGDRNRLLDRLQSDSEETPVTEDETPSATEDPPAPAAAPTPHGATVTWREEPPNVALDPGVIDGLPWQSASAPASAQQVESKPGSTTGGAPTSDPASDSSEGGVTVSRAGLLRQLAEQHEVGATVLAITCVRSHLSPTYASVCRICAVELADQAPIRVPRPPLGQLVSSDGSTITLDKNLILGRAPRSDIADAAERPNLVKLSDSGEISRMHASVTLDGWQVLLRDLGSENGTVVTSPGGEPELIRPQEDHVLEPGAEVLFADIISFRYTVSS